MTTNATPHERAEDDARHEAEFRRFAATWHPLDRVPFPTLPPQPLDDSPPTDRTPSRISGYF